MRVALFATCVTDTLYPDTARAVVRLLDRLGCAVDFPLDQTCCGQMHFNTGYPDPATELASWFGCAAGAATDRAPVSAGPLGWCDPTVQPTVDAALTVDLGDRTIAVERLAVGKPAHPEVDAELEAQRRQRMRGEGRRHIRLIDRAG